jgi:hypothetical protein
MNDSDEEEVDGANSLMRSSERLRLVLHATLSQNMWVWY